MKAASIRRVGSQAKDAASWTLTHGLERVKRLTRDNLRGTAKRAGDELDGENVLVLGRRDGEGEFVRHAGAEHEAQIES